MNAIKIILGAVSIILGIALLPVVAGFINSAGKNWNGTAWVDDTNVTGIAGLTSLLNLVGYGFAFGLVGLGIGIIAWGFKGK